MGDPQPQDREAIGAGGSEPEATVDLGTNGPPDTPGTAHVGQIDPGQTTGGVTLAHETSGTATGVGVPTHADQTDSPSTRRPAPMIAGYEIEDELGRGAMGVVYRARQVRLNRPCALKVILAGAHADPVAAVRFLGEAEAVAKLQHPHIVQIHHIGEADGLPFLELEYVEGGSLDRRLDGTPWPARRATTLVEALARGVAEAHRLGVIHRDLKPGNILIATDGTPKVADFGLAKSLHVASGLTATESILGTPSYMAPEQAEGKAKQVGPLADVYALGAVLYELLVGRPPFRGTTVLETLEQVKTAEPVPPTRLVPGLPRDAETIALKCLQKDPARRYASAAALGEDLQRFLEDRPIAARRISSAERLLRWCRRNPAVASLAGSLMLVFLMTFAIVSWQLRESERQRALLARSRQEVVEKAAAAVKAQDRAEAIAEERARELYTSDILAVQQVWEAGNIVRMGELLGRHIPTRPGQTDWRGFEWHVFQRLYEKAGHPLIRTLPASDAVWGLVATPNGQTVASSFVVYDHAIEKDQILLWDAATGRELRKFEGPRGTFDSAVALSPDGRTFATASKFDGRGREGAFVNIRDAATGELLRSLDGQDRHRDDQDGHRKDGQIRVLAFSDDGKTLISGSDDKTIKLWDLETGRVLQEFKGHSGVVGGVAVSPGGRLVASASEDLTVKLWDVKSGKALFTSPKFSDVPEKVAFSPGDGRYLAAGSWGPGARLWEVTRPLDPREIELQGQPDATASSVSFSPDGRYLAASNSNTVRLWIVQTGEESATLKGHSNLVGAVAFLDGGRTLASGSIDRTIKLWDIARAGVERDVLTAHSGSVEALAFTPEGKTLASGGFDALIKLWDAESGREHPRLEDPGEERSVSGLAIHGRTLADNRGNLWDVETGRLLEPFPDWPSSSCVVFSPEGRTLATGSRDGPILLWDVATRELSRSLPASIGMRSLAFSPDGRILATGDEGGAVILWDVANCRRLADLDRKFEGHTGVVKSLAFSSDVRTLVSGSFDGTVKIWDVADAAKPSPLRTLRGHAGMVYAVAYSPNGKTIASASEDRTIKLWDPTTGRERCTLVGHAGRVVALTFSPDGTILASVDSIGTIRLWRR